jgi:hypothetical protein
VRFFANVAPRWQEEAAVLGLAEAQADEVAELAAEAAAARAAQQAALSAARAATLRYESAVARLRTAGAACVAAIRATAARQDDEVYVAASIPAPARPSRLAAPGRPTRFDAELLQGGGLRVAWDCKNPAGSAGTVYEVWRNDHSAPGVGAGFKFVAVTGEKHWVDETIPAGTAAVEYQVTAVRSTRRGPVARHLVNFGGVGKLVGQAVRAAA